MPDNDLLIIHAVTGLHPGSGTALGVVDLPVQRERHTHWPLIPGSSLKGVLREAFRPDDNASESTWLALFGPKTDNAAEYAGALAFTDARILAFPVRSLKGVFAWVTCPAVLTRLARDLVVIGQPNPTWPVPELASGQMLCAETSPLLIQNVHEKQALLEEFDVTRQGDCPAALIAWLQSHAATDEAMRKRLASHLVVLADDDFTHFTTHATEINARIGLNYETRTVKKGALFYEEFLPPETLLYALVLAQKSRFKDASGAASQMLEHFTKGVPPFVQIGGDATVGKGICRLRLSYSTHTDPVHAGGGQ